MNNDSAVYDDGVMFPYKFERYSSYFSICIIGGKVNRLITCIVKCTHMIACSAGLVCWYKYDYESFIVSVEIYFTFLSVIISCGYYFSIVLITVTQTMSQEHVRLFSLRSEYFCTSIFESSCRKKISRFLFLHVLTPLSCRKHHQEAQWSGLLLPLSATHNLFLPIVCPDNRSCSEGLDWYRCWITSKKVMSPKLLGHIVCLCAI